MTIKSHIIFKKNLKRLKEIVLSELKNENTTIILFGSAAREDFTSYSDITAKCLFYIYLVMNEKREDLGGMTRIEVIDKQRKISLDEGFISFLRTYNDFSKKGILPEGCEKPEA